MSPQVTGLSSARCFARSRQRSYCDQLQRCAHKPLLTLCAQRQHAQASGVCSQRKLPKTSLLLQLQSTRKNSRHMLQLAATATSSPAETAVSTTVVLRQCELSFGDTVRAVGETDLFGSWDSNNAPELQWQEGHDWVAKLDVPSGVCTFKLVIVNGNGNTHWESGDNRSVTVPGDAAGGEVTISCRFNQTDSTEVQVTPAALAQTTKAPKAKAAENGAPVDDLTDDFAAGDAAVQVPAVQERAEEVQQEAEKVTDAHSAPSSQKEQAAAKVEKNVAEAAPEQDLAGSLSTLQGAEADLEQQRQPQASGKSNGQSAASSAIKADTAAPSAPQKAEAEQRPSSTESQVSEENGVFDYSSFPTFGKSRVTNIARDGAITFTFEDDDDVDIKSLTNELLAK